MIVELKNLRKNMESHDFVHGVCVSGFKELSLLPIMEKKFIIAADMLPQASGIDHLHCLSGLCLAQEIANAIILHPHDFKLELGWDFIIHCCPYPLMKLVSKKTKPIAAYCFSPVRPTVSGFVPVWQEPILWCRNKTTLNLFSNVREPISDALIHGAKLMYKNAYNKKVDLEPLWNVVDEYNRINAYFP